MGIILILVSVYPFIQTGECIRGWNKINKSRFQHWIIFWYLFTLASSVQWVLSWVWILNNYIVIYDIIVGFLLVCCYFEYISIQCRKYIVIPVQRDIRKIYPHIKPYSEHLYINFQRLKYVTKALDAHYNKQFAE